MALKLHERWESFHEENGAMLWLEEGGLPRTASLARVRWWARSTEAKPKALDVKQNSWRFNFNVKISQAFKDSVPSDFFSPFSAHPNQTEMILSVVLIRTITDQSIEVFKYYLVTTPIYRSLLREEAILPIPSSPKVNNFCCKSWRIIE